MDESKPKASSWIVKRLNDSPTGSIDGRGGVEMPSKKKKTTTTGFEPVRAKPMR